ncbi:hypothetical protein A3Q41_04054 [Rhodococcoides fascians]|uniref:Uncharacterized protein n=1 Tax=Rhodococcoides fascians TaxID=1828 RepID=A0A143QQA0_RHOFA|nr:hypothetical protein A3Q41_04054 [Rhodococcus fascians]
MGRWLFVEGNSRLDDGVDVEVFLEPRRNRIGVVERMCSLCDEVAQGACLYSLLAETGEYARDVREVGLMRTDEQYSAAVVSYP